MRRPKNPTPAETPDPPADTATDTGGTLLSSLGAWMLDHPISIPILITAAWIGALYGWSRLRKYQAQRGRALAPLGKITKDVLRFALKDDTVPVITKPGALAAKTQWLTGKRLYLILAAASTAGFILGWGGTRAALALLAILYWRAGKVFKIRRGIITQMFAVAAAECRYPKGAELAPWSYINVQEWKDQIRPGTTIVTYPAAYQSEEPKTREKFERQFNGTISDENTWNYTWESSKNRVICKPTDFLPTMAPYPGPGPKWDEFVLGDAGDEQAVWSVSSFPHALICGPTGSGKLLDTTYTLPTPAGWSTVGEISVGDQVFDQNGNPCTVLDKSPVEVNTDAYEVVFSDGSVVVADAEHLWWTETRAVRESRWTERRKPRHRRPLLTAEVVARLRQVAAEAQEGAEITIRQIADLAEVSPETGWLRDLAAEVGQVAEAQFAVAHYYPQQVVTQTQKVRLYPARQALTTLGQYQPRATQWEQYRPVAVERAAAAAEGEQVSSRVIADALGLTARAAGSLLRQHGLEPEITTLPGAGKSSLWDAQAAWGYFARTGGPSWLHLREKCLEVAAECAENEEWSLTQIADLLGTGRDSLAALLTRLRVPVRISREEVQLVVAEKQVSKASPWTRLYPARDLLLRVAEYGERQPYDQRHKQARGGVRTTLEILETLRTEHGHANHSVPVAHALMLPDADLPVAPYTFGVWLGDGSSWSGQFVGIDHEIARHVETDGYTLRERPDTRQGRHPQYRTWTVQGIRGHLNSLGVLKTNVEQGLTKRIPMLYLRASREQRAALLAGLLDTDGTVSPQGSVEITQVNRDLAYDIRELALTLGYRASIREGRAVFEGRDYGPAWTVSFTCAESPFWLSRKTEAHRERTRFHAERNAYRYIVDVRPVESVPMQCIMVDSADHQFLVGDTFIPTHNSVLQRMILFHALAHSDTWKIVGVDPKMVEMGWLKKYPSVLKIALTLEEGVEVVQNARDEMMRRYDEMSELNINHFQNLPSPPPALLVMVDETFNFLAVEGIKSDEGKERDELHARASVLLGEIARLGRAAGVHLALATQRPDATVIKGEMKNNLDCRIAAGRLDTTPSLMVMDSEAATRLPKIKGRGMIRLGGDMQTFQGFFAEQNWYDQWQAQQEAAAAAAEAGDAGPEEARSRKPKGGKVGRFSLSALAEKAAAKGRERAEALEAPGPGPVGSPVAGVADVEEADDGLEAGYAFDEDFEDLGDSVAEASVPGVPVRPVSTLDAAAPPAPGPGPVEAVGSVRPAAPSYAPVAEAAPGARVPVAPPVPRAARRAEPATPPAAPAAPATPAAPAAPGSAPAGRRLPTYFQAPAKPEPGPAAGSAGGTGQAPTPPVVPAATPPAPASAPITGESESEDGGVPRGLPTRRPAGIPVKRPPLPPKAS